MKMWQCSNSVRLGLLVVLSSNLVIGFILPGWAQDKRHESLVSSSQSADSTQHLAVPHPRTRPATTVKEWVAQIEAAIVQVTGVSYTPTEFGLEIVLQTAEGKPLAIDTSQVSSQGNSIIVDISNAVLALPDVLEFSTENPTEDIASIQVTQQTDTSIRLTVTGNNAPPGEEVTLRTGELVYSLNPDAISDEEVVVTGEQNSPYNPSNSTTATGTNTPLRDIPLSIQVIPQQVIEDRNVTELGNALETAGGVVSSGGRGTSVFGPNFLIRGFDVSDSIFRDGITYVSLAPLSTIDLERIEVLKGPASVLFGQGEPGGIINLVSKQPLSEPFYSASITVGNFDTYRGAIDLSGPLNDSRTVKYRLNISYENYDSFRDFVDGERFIISPTLTWDISPNTSINFYAQYTDNRETIDEGLVAIGDEIIDVPRDRFFGEDFGEFEQEQFNLGYRLDHRFSDNWNLRHALRYTKYEPERYAPLFDSFDEITGELSRLEYFAGGTYRRFFTNAEVIGRFNTGSVQHQILFGAEYRRDSEDPRFQFSNLYTPINVFNPVYTGVPYRIEPEFFRDDKIDTIAFYLQDQIELAPNLKVLAGLRYDHVDQFRTTQDVGQPREEFDLVDSDVTPRFGIVYQPIQPISLYASYTTSFNPSFGASRNGDDSPFEPETGRQFEVGIKADLSERLSLTFAAFDIRKQNVETPDPIDPNFSLQTGEVASRGFELNLGGEILPGWNVTAAYTYLDAFVSEDNTDIVGNRLANVPENQFGLWTTYEIQRGNFQGLGFGLGLFFVGDRQGDQDNTFTLPSYFRTDAALFYRRNNWRAQLNIQNLFDVEYFSSATFGSRLGVNPGAPFTILGTISVDF
jgi:iron complex outermembrane recepter protein